MIFTTGLSAPEGPVALADGTWLVVEGGPSRGCVTHISADGEKSSVIKQTGRPNGLAVDRIGSIWVAESRLPSLVKVTMDGHAEVVATECDGQPFLFPNDLCFGPDGALYMTDSGINIAEFAPENRPRSDYASLDYDGRVYRINPVTGSVEQIDGEILFTNGIAFGPDHALYVNETITGNIYRYEWRVGGVTGKRGLFGNVIRSDAPAGFKGPDGMAFSSNGSLFVAVFGQGDVTVLDGNGVVEKRIATRGMLPTNLAFGLPGSLKIFVTEYELGQMEIFEVGCDGLPLWDGTTPSASLL